MDRWKGKVAIVTGASAGIGAAIAEKLVEAELKVVGLARRKEKVEALAKKLQNKSGKLYALKADVSNEQEVIQAFKWIKENLGPVHILVNNAGIGRETNLVDGETQKWREIFDTNVLGLCVATREAVRDMRANNVDGHIVHINSLGGHYVPNIPNLSVYPASKFAVTALTETLRQELNSIKSKIKITSVSPGAVKTELIEASGYNPGTEVGKVFANIPWLDPADIADAVVYTLSTPPHVQIHEMMVKPVGGEW